MIRFVHVADVHIGMDNYGRVNPATGMSTRLEDFLNTLDESVDCAIERNADLYILAGDIYKTRDPTPTHQREFARRIRKLTGAGIQVVMVAGNHDLPLSPSRATVIDIFSALDVPGVHVARVIRSMRIETRNGPVQILALPWMTRSIVLADDQHKGATIEELNQRMVQMSTDRLRQIGEDLDPEIPTMVIAHAHVFGAKIGAERMLNVGRDPVLALDAFPVQNIGYIALGHIHRHQALITTDPAVVYPGSINRVDFGEEDEDKGFVLGELHVGRCKWEFVPVKARPFLTISAAVDEDAPMDSVIQAIRSQEDRLQNAVVRVQLVTTRAGGLLVKDDAIRAELKSAFLVAPVHRQYSDDLDRQHVEMPTGLAPLDALELYLRRTGRYDADRQRTLLEYARRLMAARV
jgi:DNA repair protein SbcD/Mre11